MQATEFDSFRLKSRPLSVAKVEMMVGTSTSGSLINRREWFNMSDVCLAGKLITDYRSSPLIKGIERPGYASIQHPLSSASCGRRQVAGTKMTTTNETWKDGEDDADANQICHLYLMSTVMKSLFACEQNAENANWEMGVRVATRSALASPFLCHYIFLEAWARGMAPSLLPPPPPPSRSWLAMISRNGTDAAFSRYTVKLFSTFEIITRATQWSPGNPSGDTTSDKLKVIVAL